MGGAITYEMLSAVTASLMVVGGAWFFIERRIKEVEREARITIERVDREAEIATKAAQADVALLREVLFTKYVSNEALIRLEERILNELRELRRTFVEVHKP